MSKNFMPSIINNNAIKNRLCNDAALGTFSHAYIIEGPDGSGRKTIALMAAAALACEHLNKSNTVPCMECPSCKKILAKKSPDVCFINCEDKASIGVDDMRFLKEDIYVIPNDLEHKFYIIEEADKLTIPAQNAILLTLEEPPSFVHFFLICNNATALLETIRSRAPILRTDLISNEEISNFICKENHSANQMNRSDEEEFQELITAASGSIGKALAFIENNEWAAEYKLRKTIRHFIECAVSKSSAAEMLTAISAFYVSRDALSKILNLTSNAIRDLIFAKESDNFSPVFYSSTNEAIELCDKVSLTFLYSLQSAIANAIEECKRNANVRLLLLKMLISVKLI